MEDRELILKYRVGDNYALEVLLKQNKPLINQIARKYFLIGAEIDDLIQEGMIGLYRAVTTFDATKENSFKRTISTRIFTVLTSKLVIINKQIL